MFNLKLKMFIVLILVTMNCHAASLIECYLPDGSRWKGWGYNIWVTNDYIIFTHVKNIRMRIPGKCLVASANPNDLG
jgi:hypothetical protein